MDREEDGWGKLEEWRDGLRLLCAPFPRGFSGEETLASCSCKNLADLPGMDFYQQMTAHCLGMSAAITRCLVGVGFGGGVSIMLLPQRQWADRGQGAGGRPPPADGSGWTHWPLPGLSASRHLRLCLPRAPPHWSKAGFHEAERTWGVASVSLAQLEAGRSRAAAFLLGPLPLPATWS